MKAITVVPGKPEQVRASELPDPPPQAGTLLVQGRLLGSCGTNVDIVDIVDGWPPPCRDRPIIAAVGLDEINKEMVLQNTVVFGSVNAGRRHYQPAADALATADLSWLQALITRRVPMIGFAEAPHKNADDIKVVVDLTA